MLSLLPLSSVERMLLLEAKAPGSLMAGVHWAHARPGLKGDYAAEGGVPLL